jgi:plasmid stabilization system protein ParE
MVKKKSFKVVWNRKTLDEFKKILTFLEEQNPQAPRIVKKAIMVRISIIKRNPQICEIDNLKDQKSTEFRAFVVFSY